ncbi:MAG: RNA-guided pseudouridylation complex pseudouridine synthase subunit Cbf5 [Candidatus Helarchaeota archaeon]
MNTPKLPSEIERSFLIKARDVTDEKCGFKIHERPIDVHLRFGVINLDKPSGPTSHEVASHVRKILNLKKTAHGGTLDPKVTGVLPIALENGVKIIQTFLLAGKEYVAVMHLHKPVAREEILRVCKEFQGPIYQTPPLKSSVKRRLRIRKIYYIDIIEIEDRDVLMRVGCQAGTYIRKLIYHIGKALGVGANMAELRRTKAGSLKEDQTMVRLQDVKDAYIFWKEDEDERELRRCVLPMEEAMGHVPHVIVRDSAIDAICHGASLTAPGVLQVHTGIQPNDMVGIFSLKGEIVALGNALIGSKKMIMAQKGLVVKTSRVILPVNTYPAWTQYK